MNERHLDSVTAVHSSGVGSARVVCCEVCFDAGPFAVNLETFSFGTIFNLLSLRPAAD